MIWQVLVDKIEVWIWRSWPAGVDHPELPRLHRSDRCPWPVWPVRVTCGICLGWTAWLVCLWVLVLLVSSWSLSSCFVRFCVGFFLPCRLCFGGVFVPGPREVTEALWNACYAADVATGLAGIVHRSDRVTGLTGAGHRSDRCSTGNKSCKFPLCVLVCFSSEGCVLVPRSSSTSVAAWSWPTWVVSRRRVLEAMFVLLESSSPSRRIFIGSHSLLPPSLVCRIGPLRSMSSLHGSGHA
jgi:hypothetical protein